MNEDIGDFIASLVCNREDDLPTRLQYQVEALAESACSEPSLGQLIDETPVSLLMAALAASDQELAEVFPTLSRFALGERQEIRERLDDHFEKCLHCSLKRGYDHEMDNRIEQACHENKDELLRLLDADETQQPADLELETA